MQLTQHKNVVTCYNKTITVKKGPFSNNFVQVHVATFIYVKRRPYIVFYAQCTADSNEAGRIYKCVTTLRGEITECSTVN